MSPFRTPREREAEKVIKREAVLVAAVRMFNANGFNATSLDDVAESLGVTKPVIYYYLGNKDQILLECVRRGLEQLQQAARTACDRAGTGLERLETCLIRYAEVIVSDFGACVVRTDETAMSEDSAATFRQLKRQIDACLRALIADGVADGSIAATDVRLTAFAIAGALNWAANWFNEEGPMSAGEVAKALVGLLSRGLRPRWANRVDTWYCSAGCVPHGRLVGANVRARCSSWQWQVVIRAWTARRDARDRDGGHRARAALWPGSGRTIGRQPPALASTFPLVSRRWRAANAPSRST